jgi:hypothetical protein
MESDGELLVELGCTPEKIDMVLGGNIDRLFEPD